jgi:acyl-[acyl-carrier-protein]-phospholipid O-acyltransferase/long-chain-fatty-acid--[acyl-carrier-protein] ligase
LYKEFNMSQSTSIWRGRQFMPLWYSQSLSALNDNLFRYGMITALTFGDIAVSKDYGQEITNLSAGLFVIPYLLISGVCGQIADKYPKSSLLRWCRGLEIFVFGLSGYALMAGQIPLLLTCVVLIGALAAFYGPVKLSITPELLTEEHLIDANGAIEAGTYASILIGMLLGTGLMNFNHSKSLIVVVLIMAVAVISWIFSLATPSTPAAAPSLKIDWNMPKQAWSLIKWGAEDKVRNILLLGNGWFWFVGTVVLNQLEPFVKYDLHGGTHLITLLLALFACGIGLGAWVCSALLRGTISLQFASAASFGMAFWSGLIAALVYFNHPVADFVTVPTFLHHGWTLLLGLSIVMLAANAGLFVIPIVTMMQTCVPDAKRGSLLSLSNIWFAVFIITGAAICMLCSAILKHDGAPKAMYIVLCVLCLLVSRYAFRLMPKESLKGIFGSLLRTLYRVDVIGLEHFESLGESAVIVANHQSLLDGFLLGVFLPGNPMFAIDPIAASRWWAKPLVSLVDITTLNPLQPMSVRHLIQTVQSGRHCVIFPEGRLTQTGGLMKIYSGPAVIAGKSNAPVLPVRIDGVQYTPLSYLRGILPIRWFPKVTITILPPELAPDTSHLAGHERRQAMTQNLYDLMTRMILTTQPKPVSIWQSLLDASKKYGAKANVLEDANRNPVNYEGLLTRIHVLGGCFEKFTLRSEPVGVLLPTGIAGVVTFFALQSRGRVCAMLNFTSGPSAIGAVLTAAGITRVITAHEFVEKGKLEKLIEEISKQAAVTYLEDLRVRITTVSKVKALVRAKTGYRPADARSLSPDDTAVILFTSGSEGMPKGVALSHRNLLSNVEQIRSVIAYNPKDVFFNALPIFHAFGLTGGVLVPILHGVKSFLHPTPLQYRVIPELVYHGNATILFGTDTFLSGYAHAANPYDMYTVRLIVSGAERLRPETIKLYSEKFGVPVLEGYGVTECSPAVALNTPMHRQIGTVGRMLPMMERRLVPIPGIEEGGRLWVKGPNVMKGYYKAEQPGVLQPLVDGWYDTGDIVSIDEFGYIKIKGRAKRFAKIGGEMISLAAIEGAAAERWPESVHAVVSIPDDRKGEALVLVTTRADATLKELSIVMKSGGATELSIPRSIRIVSALPQLGSGKTDYITLQKETEKQNKG